VLAVYYKALRDYVYDTIANVTDLNARITQPVNGGSGQVWGVELGARQKFQFLPAPFDGIGVSAT